MERPGRADEYRPTACAPLDRCDADAGLRYARPHHAVVRSEQRHVERLRDGPAAVIAKPNPVAWAKSLLRMPRIDKTDGQQLQIILLDRSQDARHIDPCSALYHRQRHPRRVLEMDHWRCRRVRHRSAQGWSRVVKRMAAILPRPADPRCPLRIPAQTGEVGGPEIAQLEAVLRIARAYDPRYREMWRMVRRNDGGHTMDIHPILAVGDIRHVGEVHRLQLESACHIPFTRQLVLFRQVDRSGCFPLGQLIQVRLLDPVRYDNAVLNGRLWPRRLRGRDLTQDRRRNRLQRAAFWGLARTIGTSGRSARGNFTFSPLSPSPVFLPDDAL